MMSKHITYILSQFPETHETFILREILALRRSGWWVTVISLKRCRDAIIHPESRQLIQETWYAVDRKLVLHFAAFIRVFIKHPFRVFGVLGLTVYRCLADVRRLPECVLSVLAGTALAEKVRTLPGAHIHAHWANVPATVAMVIASLNGIRYSITAHAWDIFLADPLLVDKVRKAAFVVTCTKYNRDYLRSIVKTDTERRNIFLNYHGIEPDKLPLRRKQGANRYLTIISIGRLVEQKGFNYLIEACSLLARQGMTCTCTIIGDGPLRSHLKRQIASLGQENTVQLAGSRPFQDILAAFTSADLFVLPCVISRNGDRDGIPNVIIEAMALGVPVISTDVSGIPELVRDGDTGYVVPSRDAKQLASKIEEIATKGVPGSIVANARCAVESYFDISKNIRALENIFSDHTT